MSLGVRLLGDLKKVFGDEDVMSTESILQSLHNIDESPWADLKGKPLNARGLAHLLRQYDVTSKQIPLGSTTCKGYGRQDLHDSWSRYICENDRSETKETNGTTCPRCDGEGCLWCEQ